MEPEDTTMTSWPRFLMRETSAAKLSSHARFRRPLSASTSSADPTLTTTRLASVKRRAEVLRSAIFICTQYCHLLSGGASPNIRYTLRSGAASQKKDDLTWEESTNRPLGSGTRIWK